MPLNDGFADGLSELVFPFSPAAPQIAPGSNALGVVGDGTHIYVGARGAGVIAYSGFACNRFK